MAAMVVLGGCTSGESEALVPQPVVTHTVTAAAESPQPAPDDLAEVADMDLPVAIWVSSKNAIPTDLECWVWGGAEEFSDQGLQARVLDETGAVVGVATLDAAEEYKGGCLREGTVTVPGDRAFYQLQVSRWASPVVARDEITDTSFRVQLN